LTFEVLRVSRSHVIREPEQVLLAGHVRQKCSLIPDFGLDQARPNTFLEGALGPHLGSDPFAACAMTAKWNQSSLWLMVTSGYYDNPAEICESGEKR